MDYHLMTGHRNKDHFNAFITNTKLNTINVIFRQFQDCQKTCLNKRLKNTSLHPSTPTGSLSAFDNKPKSWQTDTCLTVSTKDETCYNLKMTFNLPCVSKKPLKSLNQHVCVTLTNK